MIYRTENFDEASGHLGTLELLLSHIRHSIYNLLISTQREISCDQRVARLPRPILEIGSGISSHFAVSLFINPFIYDNHRGV